MGLCFLFLGLKFWWTFGDGFSCGDGKFTQENMRGLQTHVLLSFCWAVAVAAQTIRTERRAALGDEVVIGVGMIRCVEDGRRCLN